MISARGKNFLSAFEAVYDYSAYIVGGTSTQILLMSKRVSVVTFLLLCLSYKKTKTVKIL